MAKAGLTARYRPQNFAQVAGQDFIKSILSRAAGQDRPSHAYLFSGTRGVGKTTLARILSKAINCYNGPAPEPCNQCSSCEQITRGASPDVWEIDAASHTGVDNVRKLREDVAYSPMSGRYKVVIIDEAHMLSTSAFNALLKTLEEPPAHCVFIMATTAPEKFPATVISRCQHYVFKRLTHGELFAHLCFVLDTEGVSYEKEAVHLLTRRGSGSVRDSMSMLGQVLALGDEGLKTADVRRVLGLADQELFLRLMQHILDQDLVRLHEMVNYLLEQGLDLGFFLQEMAQCWRNMFLLSQGGQEAGKVLDLPAEEVEKWREMAGMFAASTIHAGWQMVLESRKSILGSYEPGISLELMLYNLAYLPELIPVSGYAPEPQPRGETRQNTAEKKYPAGGEKKSLNNEYKTSSSPGEPEVVTENLQEFRERGEDKAEVQEEKPHRTERDWDGFLDYCREHCRDDTTLARMLKQCSASIDKDQLTLKPEEEYVRSALLRNGREKKLSTLTGSFFGREMQVVFQAGAAPEIFDASPEEKARNHPGVQRLMDAFDARIMDISRNNDKPNS